MAGFDSTAATAAYMAILTPAQHARATAYTHGGHWLLLWGWLATVATCWLLLRSRLLVRTREGIERRRAHPNLVVLACALLFSLLSWLIGLPWSSYTDWARERSYGLTSQPYLGWLSENAVAAVISTLVSGLFFLALYALIRRSGRWWWAWSAAVTAAFFAIGLIVTPVLIEPLFNRYTPAPNGPVRDSVVALAKRSGVQSDKIYIYNGSKQSNRYTANVSGLGSTARVAMSDVMFKKDADIAEVRGVVGHEMGHYAHLHVLWLTAAFSLIAAMGFFLADRLFAPASGLLGASGVLGLADPAGLPVLGAVLATLTLLATPLLNSITRVAESDADSFSLAHAHEPDGLSRALVKTIEYRASSPTQLEEMIFYDHPSVERRVHKAMMWKAAHPDLVGK